jgi:hypothetical protein
MPLGEARSDASFAMHGKHSMLVLMGMAGHTLYRTVDPRPARRRSWSRDVGDPFWDPERPLRLTLASDMRWAGSDLDALTKMSRLPGIEIHAMPGVDDRGFESIGRIRVSKTAPHFLAGSSRSKSQSAVYLHPEWLNDQMPLSLVLGVAGKRLNIDLEVHESLGFDYLVTRHADLIRTDKRLGAYTRYGTCTPLEAWRMVGAKATMYRQIPIYVEPRSISTVNVGMWRDVAVRNLVPSLQRTIEAALGPLALDWQRQSVAHLSAIRARLVDLLVARDDCFRLMRRDALDIDELRRPSLFDREETPPTGPLGNDLLQLLSYHAYAALNHTFAISDNLAWILSAYAGMALKPDDRLGLGRLLYPPKGQEGNRQLRSLRALLKDRSDTQEMLTLRQIRNLAMHRDGMEQGAILLHEEGLGQLGQRLRGSNDLEFQALWVLARENPDLYHRLASMADFASPELRVLTFRTLIDRALSSTAGVLKAALDELPTARSDWLKKEDEYRRFAADDRVWRSSRHDRLWGFPST